MAEQIDKKAILDYLDTEFKNLEVLFEKLGLVQTLNAFNLLRVVLECELDRCKGKK